MVPTTTPSSHKSSRRRSRATRHARRGRKRTDRTSALPNDAPRVDSEPARRRPSGKSQLKAAFKVLDQLFTSLERVAWEVRDAAEDISDVWEPIAATESSTDDAAPANKYRRMAQTGWMLATVAATYRAHVFCSAFVPRRTAARALDELHEKNAHRFCEASLSHGGAFLKVGQLISARHDLLPEAWVRELSRLQDDVPPLPIDRIRPVIQDELGDLPELFEHFDESPIAAASIGQVHRARTRAGQDVAVKVQRPNVDDQIENDLELLGLFIDSVRSMLPPTDFDTIEQEIRVMVESETDYEREARMTHRVGQFFSDDPRVVVPEVVSSHCSRKVLTSTFIEGRKITDVLDELSAARDHGDVRAGQRLDGILTLLLEAYVKMVLEAGVFQADPHPGNLLVTADDRLVLLDFGATKPLDDDIRRSYLKLVRACLYGDQAQMTELLAALGFRTRSGRPDTLVAFTEALLGEMRSAVQQGAVEWPTRDELLKRTAHLLQQVDEDPVVTLPPEFVMIGRVFSTLGGLFSHYRPNVDYMRALMPVLGQVMSAA